MIQVSPCDVQDLSTKTYQIVPICIIDRSTCTYIWKISHILSNILRIVRLYWKVFHNLKAKGDVSLLSRAFPHQGHRRLEGHY